MKKIATIIFIFLFSIVWVQAEYSPNQNDKQALKNIQKIIENKIVNNIKKRDNLFTKIGLVFEQEQEWKLNISEKNIYILWELYKILQSYKNTEYRIVSRIVDGDTIEFYDKWNKVKGRLIGIDAPENSKTRYGYTENLGSESKDHLSTLIVNQEVRIEYDPSQSKTDRYGRYLIYIFLGEVNIGNQMIADGYAKEYTYNKKYKYQSMFKKSEKKAKKERIKMWLEYEEELQNLNSRINNNPIGSQIYYSGSRGGCYYLTVTGNKVYVERGLCAQD